MRMVFNLKCERKREVRPYWVVGSETASSIVNTHSIPEVKQAADLILS